jgi:hypothetical protein
VGSQSEVKADARCMSTKASTAARSMRPQTKSNPEELCHSQNVGLQFASLKSQRRSVK